MEIFVVVFVQAYNYFFKTLQLERLSQFTHSSALHEKGSHVRMYGLYVVKLKVKPPNLKMVPVLCQEISWI
jgi:hypothetical protein